MVLLPFTMLTSFVCNLASQHSFLPAHYDKKKQVYNILFQTHFVIMLNKTLTCSLVKENCVFNILSIMLQWGHKKITKNLNTGSVG